MSMDFFLLVSFALLVEQNSANFIPSAFRAAAVKGIDG